MKENDVLIPGVLEHAVPLDPLLAQLPDLLLRLLPKEYHHHFQVYMKLGLLGSTGIIHSSLSGKSTVPYVLRLRKIMIFFLKTYLPTRKRDAAELILLDIRPIYSNSRIPLIRTDIQCRPDTVPVFNIGRIPDIRPDVNSTYRCLVPGPIGTGTI
jgi:hypothetical protein